MNKMVIIIIAAVVAVLVIGGGVAFFLLSGEPAEPEIVYSEYEMEEMYTNIDDPSKILKFRMVIEYTVEGTDQEILKHQTEIMNNTLEIFRRKTAEDTQKSSFQERVREEIREMVIEVLESDGETITNVYFKDFIFQG